MYILAKKLKIEKSKRKAKWNIFNCADPPFENEMISGAHIEAFGNSKISIDGCLGVFEYSESYIKLKLAKGYIILCGNNLEVAFFENRLITINGKISSLEFCL